MILLKKNNEAQFETSSLSLEERLKKAFYMEDEIAYYYRNLASYIRNGRVRNECQFFASIARSNKQKLVMYLKRFEAAELPEGSINPVYTIKPDSLSLLGMINLGLERSSEAIRAYKAFIRSTQDEERALYFDLFNLKRKEWKFLRREKRFHERRQESIFNAGALYRNVFFFLAGSG